MRYYNGWTTSTTDYTINSNLFYQCSIYKVFGAQKFGKLDIIKKTFSNIPNHSQVKITFDLLKMDLWNFETFSFKVDGTLYYTNNFSSEGSNLCGGSYNENITPIIITIYPHSSSSLVLEFQSSLDRNASQGSYGIQNLFVYLVKDCDSSCMTCLPSAPSICTTCPFFAKLNSSNKCECRDKFYMENIEITHCVECHITCMTCEGPTNFNCLSCYEGDTLDNGTCVSSSSLNFI